MAVVVVREGRYNVVAVVDIAVVVALRAFESRRRQMATAVEME